MVRIKGVWHICVKTYNFGGTEVRQGQIQCSTSTHPEVAKYWRKATKKEIKNFTKNELRRQTSSRSLERGGV
jgi:hypothetical protein